jgi:uncharacterized protein DUF4198
MSLLPRAVCMMTVLLAAPVARAHDFYLIPATSSPGSTDTLDVTLHVSDVFPGEPAAWRTKQTREFFMLDGVGRLDLMGSPVRGEPPKARVLLRSEGTIVIALVSEPSYIEMEPAEFKKYLRHEGHDEILTMRKEMQASGAPGRERYSRYVKTLVDANGEGSDVSLATLGLTIEIVPEARPADLRPGDRLPVRAYFEGAPYAGGYLCATHAGYSKGHDDYAWCGRLDGEGRAQVPIPAPGWQIVRTTRMRALAGDEKADWVSYWGALTFDVRGAPK